MKRALTCVSKRCVTEIVCETDSLNQVWIDKKLFMEKRRGLFQKGRDGPTDLSYFQRMGQPCPVEIEFATEKYLGLGLQSSKSRAVDDPVAISLKRGPVIVGLPWLETFDIKVIVESVTRQRPHEEPF